MKLPVRTHREDFGGVHSAERSEAGLTIVEVVVAMSVLAVALTGLAQFWSTALITTLRTRQREAAVALAGQQAEQLRSSGYNRLVLPSGSPASYTADDGTTYTTLIDSTNQCAVSCLTYSQNLTQGQFSFNLKTIVAGIHDPADLTPGAIDYKRLFLTLSSVSSSGPAFTYKMQTDIHNLNKDPTVAVQGVSIIVQDVDGDTGAQVLDDTGNPMVPPDGGFTVDVSGIADAGGTVDDGQYNNFNLASGTYTCTVTNTSTTPDWAPYGNPSANSQSFPCNVSDGQITQITVQWSQYGCHYTVGSTGNLQVAVTDAGSGNPLSGAAVSLTATSGGGQPSPSPATVTSDSSGNATWTGIAVGGYNVGVSKAGYVSQTGLQTCVYHVAPTSVPVALTSVPQPATVNVQILNGSGGPLNIEVQIGSLTQTQTVAKAQVLTYTLTPAAGTYTVYVYTVGCKPQPNLKTSWANQTFAAGGTYWIPGPDSTKSYKVGGC